MNTQNFIVLFLFTLALLTVNATSQLKWKTFGNLKQPRMFFNSLYIGNNEVLVAGGFTATDSANGKYTTTSGCEIINLKTGQITPTASMIFPRVDFVMLLTPDSNVIAISGAMNDSFSSGGSNINTPTIEIFDRNTKRWSLLGSINSARRQHTATFISPDEVLIVGGRDNTLGAIRLAEIFNIKTGTVKSVANYPFNRCEMASTVSSSGTPLFFSGREGGPNSQRENNLFTFQTSTNMWSQVSEIYSGVRLLAHCKLWDGRVLFCGGFESEAPYMASNQIWIEDNDKCTAFSRLNIGRGAHAIAQFDESRVVVTGTWLNDWSTTTNTAEIINLRTGVTTFLATLSQPRAAHCMVAVPNIFDSKGKPIQSRILVIGGATQRIVDGSGNSSGYFITSSVEILEECNTQVEMQIIGNSTLCANESVTAVLTKCYPQIQWWNGASSLFQTISSPGTYSVSIRDDNGCDGQKVFSIIRDVNWAKVTQIVHDTSLTSSSVLHTVELNIENISPKQQTVKVSDIRLLNPDISSITMSNMPVVIDSLSSRKVMFAYTTPLAFSTKDSIQFLSSNRCPLMIELPKATKVKETDPNIPSRLCVNVSVRTNDIADNINVLFQQPINSIAKVEVFSIDGKQEGIYSMNVSSTSLQIPIEHLSNGKYYVMIEQGSLNCIKSFIVTR